MSMDFNRVTMNFIIELFQGPNDSKDFKVCDLVISFYLSKRVYVIHNGL